MKTTRLIKRIIKTKKRKRSFSFIRDLNRRRKAKRLRHIYHTKYNREIKEDMFKASDGISSVRNYVYIDAMDSNLRVIRKNWRRYLAIELIVDYRNVGFD